VIASRGALVEGRHGFGRLIEVTRSRAIVEYFDRPGASGTVREVEAARDVHRAVLTPQTRVHWRNDEHWDHGRVIEHHRDDGRVVVRASKGRELVLPESSLVIRWRRRLRDANALLADGWLETRRFYDARQAFVHGYLAREASYQGITAIASSAIEVHPHQVEAVRRVITDVRPRYLLADEVGLGKTIEAGLLVRQHLLDRRIATVVVAVPEALVSQWSDEFERKFRIHEHFPGRCRIIGHPALERRALSRAPSLLVIDEAHRLTRRDGPRYRALRDVALQATGVLLLSATPLLEEAASLLRLLHLLSPEVYGLDDVAAFDRALASRDEIASLFGNLTEETQPLFLQAAGAGLREHRAEDRVLGRLLDDVEAAFEGDEAVLAAAVRRARSHVTEAHRVHNRMMRTRRDVGLAEEFPVLGRIPPRVDRLDGALTDVAVPYTAWREWVLAQAERAQADEERRMLGAAALPVVHALSSAGATLADAVAGRLDSADGDAVDAEEAELLRSLLEAARLRARTCPRIAAAVERAAAACRAGTRVAVAAGTEAEADAVQAALGARGTAPVLRISRDTPVAAREFEEAQGGVVLVLGPVGEEGQNLQAADTVVHLDLPWDANRLEQRLGRFDRFGAGTPCEHVVLLDDVDSPANAWYDLLNDGFGIFSGSIASLQQANERLKERLDDTAALEDPGALRGLADWVASELEQEIGAVELAELLDEAVLDELGRDLLDSIDDAEGREATDGWRDAVVRWASGAGPDAAHLRFHHREQGGHHQFRLVRFDHPNVARLRDTDLPLVPWSDLQERFSGSMPDAEAHGAFRRTTAMHRGLRLFGPGDPFIDALWDFTEIDDRGRAYAMWRARPYWKHDEALLVCFDLRIRPEIRAAIEASGSPVADVEAALRRRAESYLAPVSERVWLGTGGKPVANDALLKVLDAPYSAERGDQTLRPAMWHVLDVHVPRDRWAAWCAGQQKQAHAVVHARTDLDRRCAEAAARAAADIEDQVARLAARGNATDGADAELERAVGAALVQGLRNPDHEVDAVGIVVLSDAPLAAQEDG
jgi:ATP-dependent helicase HepA